jgi:carbon-monoxide dehydrogenase large subunit
VSDRLGLAGEAIRIAYGDTDVVPHGKGTFGSRSITSGGTALLTCLGRIVGKSARIAAEALEVAPEDVAFEDGRFTVIGTDRGIGFADVARLAHRPRRAGSEIGFGLMEASTESAVAPSFPNSAHVCEVEIDPDTGGIRIVAYSAADDVGRVINPRLAIGQLHGGLAQGLGEALFERITYDHSGQLLSGSFTDYAMPRAADLPAFAAVDACVPTRANPLGAKGAGEAGAVGAPVAVVNAVADALRGRDTAWLHMPLTSELLWTLLRSRPTKQGELAEGG